MNLRWCILCLGLLTDPAAAQDLPGDPGAGRQLAEAWCGTCHEVVPGSLHPETPKGPPFLVIADDPAVTEAGLRAFLQTPHADMPDIRLTHEQATDIIAYILSLRGEESAP
jgi:cytochrome c